MSITFVFILVLLITLPLVYGFAHLPQLSHKGLLRKMKKMTPMSMNRLNNDIDVSRILRKASRVTAASLVGLGFLNCGISSISQVSVVNSFKVEAKEKSNLKSDSQFEVCISKCVFMETKPPPVGSTAERLEVKSRTEAMLECKVKCAKSPEQLLLGQPKARKEAEEK